jgi:hypothetical protein
MRLAVIDRTRECLPLIADTSISGIGLRANSTARLSSPVSSRRSCDNGTELTTNAILGWAIAPGKPMQNVFVESFIGGPGKANHVSRGEGPLFDVIRNAKSQPRTFWHEEVLSSVSVLPRRAMTPRIGAGR